MKPSNSAPKSVPPTILVVEDEPILRFALVGEIRQAGFHVREAANADEAETVLETGAVIDLIVTDIEMPGSRDGLALARTVRAFRPAIKLIVASGVVPVPALAGLADAYFDKPYDFERIVRRIEALIGRP